MCSSASHDVAVRPLHLVEHEHDRPIRREPAEVLRQLGEQSVLAAGLHGPIARAERQLEVCELLPLALRRGRKAVGRTEERAPHAVRLAHLEIRRGGHGEQSASKSHLRLELPHERRRAHPRFAEDRDDPRMSDRRFIQAAHESRHLGHASREPIDRQRAMQRLVMRQWSRGRAVAPLRLDPRECSACRLEHAVERMAVVRRRRRANRQRDPSEPVAEVVVAHDGTDPFADRASPDRRRARQHDHQAIAAGQSADVVVGSQRVPHHFRDRRHDRLGRRVSARDRIDLHDQQRDRLLGRSPSDRRFRGGDELLRRPVEMRHDYARGEGNSGRTRPSIRKASAAGATNSRAEAAP